MNNPFETIDKRLSNIEALVIDLTHSSLQMQQNFVPKEPAEYLTRTEVSKLLKCDLSSVHNWSKKGILKPYSIANRVYYKRSEVEAVLIPLRRTNNTSIEQK